MKKTKKDKTDWRAKYDTLLVLLFKVRHDRATLPLFTDMCMRSADASKIKAIMDSNKRFEWRTVGTKGEDAIHYLFPLYDPTVSPVAWVTKKKRGRHEYNIVARGFKSENGQMSTSDKARAYVETHFELLRKENAS